MIRGRYNDVCLRAWLDIEAHTVMLIVLGGKLGAGFSVSSIDPKIGARLPELLRHVADEIERNRS